MLCCKLERAHLTVLRLRTSKYYSRNLPYYNVLLQTTLYYSVLQSILRDTKIEDIPHELLQGIFYLKCFRATTQKVVQIEDGL